MSDEVKVEGFTEEQKLGAEAGLAKDAVELEAVKAAETLEEQFNRLVEFLKPHGIHFK